MSQNIASLNLIEKEAGLAGYLLRPLSAKVLEKTIVEEKGLIEEENPKYIKNSNLDNLLVAR